MAISKEFKIGIFVVAVLIATFIIINILRGADLLGREITLKGRFDNVETLVASAPVQIRGYDAGRVTSVEYDPESDDFVVEISVDRRFRIPSDSRMMIYSTSIMGGKGINIEYGTSSTCVSDSDTLQTGSNADLLGTLSASITPLMERIGSIADSLQSLIASAGAVLGEENRSAVASSLSSLNSTMRNVESITCSLGGKTDEINAIVDNFDSLVKNLSPTVEYLNSTLENVSSISASLKNAPLQETVSSLNEAVTEISNAVEDIKVPVTNFIADTDSLVNAIKGNPKKYIKVSVF